MEKVINAYELRKILTKAYGEDIQIDKATTIFSDDITGTFKGSKIKMEFKPEKCLVLSSEGKDCKQLEEIFSVLNEVMNFNGPICSYYIKDGLDTPFVEWNVENPDARIKKVVNGIGFYEDAQPQDLILYNNKKIEDYIETEEERKTRIANTRVHGIDPGCIKDVKKYETISELDLFLDIDEMNRNIWYCFHEMADERMPYTSLAEEIYALDYMIYQTTRFGVTLKKPTIGKRIKQTESYNAWYEYYDSNFRNLNRHQLDAFAEAYNNGGNYDKYVPSVSWLESFEQDKVKTKKK